MIDQVLFEAVAHLVRIIDMHVGIVGIDLAATGIDGQEDGFNAAGSLRHQTGRSRRSDGQTGQVTATVLHHVLIQLLVGLLQTEDKGILGFALGIENLEGSTLLRHLHTRAVGVQRQRLVNLDAEVSSLLRTVAKSHGGNHVTLGSDAYTRAATLRTLGLDFLPQVVF